MIRKFVLATALLVTFLNNRPDGKTVYFQINGHNVPLNAGQKWQYPTGCILSFTNGNGPQSSLIPNGSGVTFNCDHQGVTCAYALYPPSPRLVRYER